MNKNINLKDLISDSISENVISNEHENTYENNNTISDETVADKMTEPRNVIKFYDEKSKVSNHSDHSVRNFEIGVDFMNKLDYLTDMVEGLNKDIMKRNRNATRDQESFVFDMEAKIHQAIKDSFTRESFANENNKLLKQIKSLLEVELKTIKLEESINCKICEQNKDSFFKLSTDLSSIEEKINGINASLIKEFNRNESHFGELEKNISQIKTKLEFDKESSNANMDKFYKLFNEIKAQKETSSNDLKQFKETLEGFMINFKREHENLGQLRLKCTEEMDSQKVQIDLLKESLAKEKSDLEHEVNLIKLKDEKLKQETALLEKEKLELKLEKEELVKRAEDFKMKSLKVEDELLNAEMANKRLKSEKELIEMNRKGYEKALLAFEENRKLLTVEKDSIFKEYGNSLDMQKILTVIEELERETQNQEAG